MRFRRLIRVAVPLIAGLSVAGCLAPSSTYVADSNDAMYFKVPPSWHEISVPALESAEGPSMTVGPYLWSRAYEASATPSVQQVFASSLNPVAYASVLSLNTAARSDVSFDSMRDLLLPVTSQARSIASQAHESLSGFALLSDQVITNGDHDRGIREIFDYNLGFAQETFDLTVMTNSDTTKIYFLLVHCSSRCFEANYPEIEKVVGSFTVGGGS